MVAEEKYAQKLPIKMSHGRPNNQTLIRDKRNDIIAMR
jgi:hypothetical protein